MVRTRWLWPLCHSIEKLLRISETGDDMYVVRIKLNALV